MKQAFRRFLDRQERHFLRGGRYERYGALFELFDTFFYTPATVTRVAPHVRDGIDLKRVMIYVWLAVLPCVFFGMYNVGLQANGAMPALGVDGLEDWRGAFLALMGAIDRVEAEAQSVDTGFDDLTTPCLSFPRKPNRANYRAVCHRVPRDLVFARVGGLSRRIPEPDFGVGAAITRDDLVALRV